MSDKEKILKALKSGEMCDDCLSYRLKFRHRQQANSPARKLEDEGRIVRQKGKCPICHKSKFLNRIIESVPETDLQQHENRTVMRNPIIKTAPQYSRGKFSSKIFDQVLIKLANKLNSKKIEVYNEFSLQHEIGIILRELLPEKRVQFERNVSYFGFPKEKFYKREIDIVVFDKASRALEAVFELKFPNNGRYPEEMFSFCEDIAFTEQLKKYGFATAYSLIVASDHLFYQGGNKTDGIYRYFRAKKPLTGIVKKPTKEKKKKKTKTITIKGEYLIEWRTLWNRLKYAVVEAL